MLWRLKPRQLNVKSPSGDLFGFQQLCCWSSAESMDSKGRSPRSPSASLWDPVQSSWTIGALRVYFAEVARPLVAGVM
jgi:hypothetical protein